MLAAGWHAHTLNAPGKFLIPAAEHDTPRRVRAYLVTDHNGKRTLPLDDKLVSALTELRKRQARESEAAGTHYRAGLDDLDWYTPGDEYVVTNELGIPVHP
jgi:hypothetical protein